MKVQPKKVKIETLSLDPHNPRSITKEKFEELKQSIKDFPEMESVKPLTIADGFVIGGNMRLLAMKDLGYREVLVNDVTEWTQAQRDEFMIKDNTHYGAWDYDILANEWDVHPLNDWGLDLWEAEPEEMQGLTDEDKLLKAINIEFEINDYNKANDILKKLKKSNTYIGALVLSALKNKLNNSNGT
jgi:hypothetical protein